MKYHLTFEPEKKTVEVEKGTTILEAAMNNNIVMRHDCGGNLQCTTCRVIIRNGKENLSPMAEKEKAALQGKAYLNYRLSCQAKIYGDVTVFVATSSLLD
jgi:2Fe-2S iron-sulfur cluster binding domain.